MRFFVGVHHLTAAQHFDATFVSVNTLRSRKSDFKVNDWIMDSGAFTEVVRYGGYRFPPSEYAHHIRRWSSCGNLIAAVSQDFMCEPFVLQQTGLKVTDHQKMSVDRYDALQDCDVGGVTIMPVLQGYATEDYVSHIKMYGDRLTHGMYVGVGSVCKRQGNIRTIEEVLLAIHDCRPDLRLHGFGVKTTALRSGLVRSLLESADSMAWSYGARRQGRNANDWREAQAFCEAINTMQIQPPLFVR